MKQGYLQIWNQEFFKPFLFYFVQELWFDSLRHVGDKTFISATFAWHSQHLHAFGWLVGPSQSRLLHNLTIFTFCTRFWCSSLLKIFFSLLSSCPRRKYVARYDMFDLELQWKWIYWSLFVQRYTMFVLESEYIDHFLSRGTISSSSPSGWAICWTQFWCWPLTRFVSGKNCRMFHLWFWMRLD